MAKLNPTLKVLLTLTIIASVSIAGINFLRGKNLHLFDDAAGKYYAVFSRIGNLERGDRVKMNGLEIGRVVEIEEIDKELKNIRVAVRLTKKIVIPLNSVAYINTTTGGLPTTFIIEKGNATTNLTNGETIRTVEMPESSGNQSGQAVRAEMVRVLRNFLDQQDSILRADSARLRK